MIVKFETFQIKVFATQVLMIGTSILIAAQLFSPKSISDLLITLFTLSAFVIAAIYVIRSVKREIEEKERVLKLNKLIDEQNAKIESQKETLEDLLKIKDETLHIVNHQLNTPISVIRSAAAMFKDKLWDNEKFLQVLDNETNRLTGTVAEFLSARSVDKKDFNLNKSKVDIGTLVKSLVEEKKLLKKVREDKINIKYAENNSGENLPSVNVDLPKIQEVISNLIDNAINYSRSEIVVTLKKENIDNVESVCFSVKDSGIGIAPENISKLFSRFTRLENAQKTRPDGTGLGLYVCKQIIELHGGKIWVESPGEGKGSIFYVILPII